MIVIIDTDILRKISKKKEINNDMVCVGYLIEERGPISTIIEKT